MSTIFKDITDVDALPSHVETRSKIFGRPFGKRTFRSRRLSQDCNMFAMQLGSRSNVESISERRSRAPAVGSTIFGVQNRLNQDLTINYHVNRSAATRTFGLQSRISSSVPSLHHEESSSLNQISNNVHQRNNISAISRTFGLVPEDLNSLSLHNNEKINQELRRNNNVDSSIVPRPLGLQMRNLPSHSHLLSQENFTVNPSSNIANYRSSNINLSTISRTSGLNSENMNGLNLQDNGGFNQDSRRNSSYSFGLQSRNLTLHSNLLPEGDLRFNQDSNSNQRSGAAASVSKTFGPAIRSTTLTTGFQMKDSMKYSNDVIDNGGFRRPNLSRIIRGRNSTLSSRLFQNQNTRHCKDLSNINGFNVSHISRRDMDTLSESRFMLNMRNNCMDNQSIAGSILSVTSMKSQFLNLLENLHHSILSIGPHVTAEAVRMEFDRAKQRLENISEMSFAPSINEAGAVSVINQSSKYICPPICEPTATNTIDGEKEGERGKALVVTSSPKNEFNDEDDSSLLFKKPKPYNKKKKSPRMMKTKAPQVVKTATPKATHKMINLKQWYPIAVGSDLAFCGVDDRGATVKTVPVKKRLSNRKIELINGLGCNLIGSPSATVTLLPKKIINWLKNGLTDRWRVLQRELLNCQTVEEEINKRKSKSPKMIYSPEKKKRKSPERNNKKGKFKSPKVISTPKKKGQVAGMLTRSGRAVKPPTMFWMVTGSDEVTSSLAQDTFETNSSVPSKKKSKKTLVKKSKKITSQNKKDKKTNKNTPNRKAKALNDSSSSRKCKKEKEESQNLESEALGNSTPRAKERAHEASFKKPNRKPLKVKTPKANKKKESEEVKVHSSTEDAKRQVKTRQAQGKRRREVTTESDSIQAKKSKLEKKAEVEVESTVETVERANKRGKKKTNKLSPNTYSTKPKGIQSHSVKEKRKSFKKKAVSKKILESQKETKEVTEFEEDFEFKLDDIEIPEIVNVSGNPQLSRSQLKLVSMETPPLKYFNNNLKLLGSATPVRSPDWCISQRTESEVKQFQRRREEAFKKKVTVDVKKTVITEKIKNMQSKDVKRVMEWVAEKNVRSPQWNSKLLQYVLPSRKRMEQQDDEEEEEDLETGFL